MKKRTADILGATLLVAGILFVGGDISDEALFHQVLVQYLVGLSVAWTGLIILRDSKHKYKRSIQAFRYRGSR